MTSSLQIKPRRILFLVTNLTFGGAETQVVRLASEFKDRDWELTVVSMMQPEIWVEQLRGRAIEVRTLGMDRGVPDFRAIFRLRRIVKELSPDVVHCHMFHANIQGRIARLFCSMPVLVSTVHNLRETSERGGSTGWKELLYRITDRLATRTTIICQAAFDRYVKVRAVPAQRLEMIPNGIDVEAFRPDAEARARARQALGIDSQFVWLAVGRMVQQKDYPNLFRALTLIPNADYTVLIAGNGPLENELRAECQRLGLDSQVRFLGVREDIRDLYNAADAYVMSSEFEGFSMALLEAACTELPIVATDAGGNREIVENGVTGHIVPPQNPAELSAAMCRVMNTPKDERLAIGKAARNYCQHHFQIQTVIEKWVELFARYSTGNHQPLGSMLHSSQSEQRGSIS